MLKYFIILNPISGRGSGLRHKEALVAFAENNKLDFKLVETAYPGHAMELASQAVIDGYDIIVSAGGDGTANEVINGIVTQNTKSGKKAKMAVIPVGRGNDYAYSMGVPADFEKACEILVNAGYKSVDVGRITGGVFPEGRYFGNGVGIGFDAVVGFEALKLKFLTGFPSYIVAAIKTIFLYYKAPFLQVNLDTQQLQGRYLMVSIMNGIRLGGGFYIAPDGNPSDGSFTICVVDSMGKLQTFPMISKFLKGTQTSDPRVKMLASQKVVIQSIDGGIPCHADGETVCEQGKEVSIELLPAALDIII